MSTLSDVRLFFFSFLLLLSFVIFLIIGRGEGESDLLAVMIVIEIVDQ